MELPRSTSDDMAPTTRRSSNSDGVAEPVRSAGAPRTDRRRRTSAATHPLATENTSRPNKRPKLDFDDDDDPFKDSDDKMSSVAKGADNGLDMIDLTEPNKLPEELAKPSEELPKNDNRTKLSAFQCAICMDDATALTVTHCGKSQHRQLDNQGLLTPQSHRPSLLCPVSALFTSRRNDKG